MEVNRRKKVIFFHISLSYCCNAMDLEIWEKDLRETMQEGWEDEIGLSEKSEERNLVLAPLGVVTVLLPTMRTLWH